MSGSRIQSDIERPAMTALRVATCDLHQRLHEHTLMLELFTRPSLESYQAVLRGFLRFYRPVEPALVECCRRLGVADRYPRAVRTQWLVADLESLDCESDRATCPAGDHQDPLSLNSLGEVAGCLYVIEGSALGGPFILQRIRGEFSVARACRFFTSGGVRSRPDWDLFQAFCERVCESAASRRAAIRAARETFESVLECLTRAAGPGAGAEE